MNRIIVFGKKFDDSITNFLKTRIDNIKFISNLYDFNIITLVKKNRDKLFFTEIDEYFSLDNGILIVKNNADISKLDLICDNSIVIVNSENKHHLEALSYKKPSTITCGLSSKDTITFSSKSQDRAVLSLQRSIKNIYGQIVEPFEIPIKNIEGIDDYAVLSFFAINILCSS